MIKKWLILGLAWLLVACGTRDEVAGVSKVRGRDLTKLLLPSE